MSIETVESFAIHRLKKWEALLTGMYSEYPIAFKEWLLLDDLRLHHHESTEFMFKHSSQYPLIHKLLHDCWDLIESDFEQVFPATTQKNIYDLKMLSVELTTQASLNLDNLNNLQNKFIRQVEEFKTPRTACTYYKELDKAFKASVSILNKVGIESPDGLKVLKMVSRLHGAPDLSSIPTLYKILEFAEKKGVTPEHNWINHIKTIIREGETDLIEFKESLSFDIKNLEFTQEKREEIESMCLKTVASYLNTKGGTLLIGVHDNGDITGLDNDLKTFYNNDLDKMILHWQNILDGRLKGQTHIYVETKPTKIDGKLIIYVECESAKRPIYCNKAFYYRKYKQSVKLTGNEFKEYIESRFSYLHRVDLDKEKLKLS